MRALKDNHPQLREDVALWLEAEAAKGALAVHEGARGRATGGSKSAATPSAAWLAQNPGGAGLRAVGRVESARTIGGRGTTEHRYYLASLTSLERFADAVRGHWAIENGQHWVLDVRFGEGANRARKGHSAENLGLVRRMALNVIRHNGPLQAACASASSGLPSTMIAGLG